MPVSAVFHPAFRIALGGPHHHVCDPDRDFVIAARAAVHLDGARCRDATDVIVETIDTLLHLVTADRQRRRDLSARLTTLSVTDHVRTIGTRPSPFPA